MKQSRRNLANAVARNERLAAGKPLVSAFERKRLPDEEVQARLHPERAQRAAGGVRKG